jgi:hypothetical protein
MGILDDIDGIVKFLIYIPIILVSIYVLYILGKGAKHKIDHGELPPSWYITRDQLLKSALFVIWPIIGIFKVLKYLIYDILILYAPNRQNRIRSILLLITAVVVTINYWVYFDTDNTLKYKFLIDYSRWITGILSVGSIILLMASFVSFIGRAEDFPEAPDFDKQQKWEDLPKIQKKFVKHQTKEHLKVTIIVGLCVAIIGLVAYYAMYKDTVAILTNYFMTTAGTITLMFAGYFILKKYKFFQSKYGRILFNILFIVPCVFFMLAEYLYKELKHTPKSAYYVLMAEIIGVILLIIIPLIKKIVYTKSKADSNSGDILKQKVETTQEELDDLNRKIRKMTDKYEDYLTKWNWDELLQNSLNAPNKKQELISFLIELGLDNPENCKDENKDEKKSVKASKIKDCQDERKKLLTDMVQYIQTQAPKINRIKVSIIEVEKKLELETKDYNENKSAFLTSKILVGEPIYLNKAKTVGTFENLPRGTTTDGIHNFNYSLSCWVFIHSNPTNFKYMDGKYCTILNYSGKPEISYNVKDNTLRVTMVNGKKSEKKKIIFEDKYFPMQKWNNIVLNYQQGTLDIFINSKLKNTYTGVVPYMEVDSVVAGQDKGVSGGICNILYSPSYMSKFRIETNYTLLKNKSPPVV